LSANVFKCRKNKNNRSKFKKMKIAPKTIFVQEVSAEAEPSDEGRARLAERSEVQTRNLRVPSGARDGPSDESWWTDPGPRVGGRTNSYSTVAY
jgi:hypothetical protein